MSQIVNLILQVVGQMPECPPAFRKKSIQITKNSGRDVVGRAGSQQTFVTMWLNRIILVVQKRKNVEPVGPVQHFLL